MTKQNPPGGNSDDAECLQRANGLVQQGIALHKTGKYQQAASFYLDALTYTPEHPDALHYLGLISRESGQLESAKNYLQRAYQANPENANLNYNLALTLQQLGHITQAVEHYQICLVQKPEFSQAYNNLGVLLQEQGEHQAALDVFKEALKHDSARAETYYNLVRCIKFTEFPDEANKIQHLLEQSNDSQSEQATLHFALGKIYDDLGEYDQAFSHFKLGNDLSTAYFDEEQFSVYVDEIIKTQSTPFFAQHSDHGLNDTKPLFIVGMPRSGTTLLEQMLCSHAQIHGAGELDYMNAITMALPQIVGEQKSPAQSLSQLEKGMSQSIAQDYLKQVSILAPDASFIIDKAPLNFIHLGVIHLLFPQAKIIHIQRSPLDTCLSCYFQHFNAQHAYAGRLEFLVAFYKQYQRLMAHWQKVLSKQLINVEYESLVKNPEDEMQNILRQLDIPWDASCLAFYAARRRVTSASQWQVRQPLYNSSISRWKAYKPHIQTLIDAFPHVSD